MWVLSFRTCFSEPSDDNSILDSLTDAWLPLVGYLWQSNANGSVQSYQFMSHRIIFIHENSLMTSMGVASVCDVVGHGGIVTFCTNEHKSL